jgi:hypothetical protein
MNRFMFLAALGALLHKRGIKVRRRSNMLDTRIHILVIQASRTGKGVSLSLMREFCEAMKWLDEEDEEETINFVRELQITDAAIVGTIDGKIAERNRAKGIDHPDDPDYREPVIIGDLGLYDVVAFSEAKQMFKAGAHNEDLLELIQSAADQPGWIDKKLAGENRIRYISNATIVGTTYFLDEFKELLLKQGIFQRFLVMVRDLTFEERMALDEMMIDEPDAKHVSEKYLENPSEYVSKELAILARDIVLQVGMFDKDIVLSLDDSGRRKMRSLHKQFKNYLSGFSGIELEILMPFSSAIIELYIKLGAIAAVLNGSKTIGKKELNEVRDEVTIYTKSIVDKILASLSAVDQNKIRKTINTILNDNNNKGRSEEDLKKFVLKELDDVNPRRVNMVLKAMIQNKEIIKDSKKILKLNKNEG